jgi:hypothetical protein
MKNLITIGFIVLTFMTATIAADQSSNSQTNPYSKWQNGPSQKNDFFPITVWLQSPRNAAKYQAIGINTYIGLWNGPTEKQLAELKQVGMKVICAQNKVGLKHLNDPMIIAWMHGDEPDNAQSLGQGKGYGPPILPSKIETDYIEIKKNDPSRPVILNLGQGVAWDGWHGRGVRTNHPEDYPEYIKGCDIASFDIYPAVHSKPQVAGNLWYVARGVQRLVKWSEGKKIVWNCIECTRINNPKTKATPHQVRAEVWMAIIHGSMGLIYFVHEWQPKFNEAALLSDTEMKQAVAKINRRITQLAPVLNSPTLENRITVTSSNANVPIAALVKKYQNAIYLFTVAMRSGATKADFKIKNLPGAKTITVLDENRTLTCRDGVFQDSFQPWDVHLYKITNP